MDGAPMITQCPQPAYTTFQYKFRASAPGTHMYHSHSAADAADGLSGAFIVRQSPRMNPMRDLYDVDATEHTIFVAEWGHSMGPLAGMTSKVPNAESLLINGKGKTTDSPDAPLTRFSVKSGKRYLFRLAYSGGAKSCPVKISFDKHVLKLVALDGHNIMPEDVESIELGKGERADFVLEANQVSGIFKVRVKADEACQEDLKGLAELVYEENGLQVVKEGDLQKEDIPRAFTTVYSDSCVSDDILCLDEVRSTKKIPEVLSGEVDKTIFVSFNYSTRQISAKRLGE